MDDPHEARAVSGDDEEVVLITVELTVAEAAALIRAADMSSDPAARSAVWTMRYLLARRGEQRHRAARDRAGEARRGVES